MESNHKKPSFFFCFYYYLLLLHVHLKKEKIFHVILVFLCSSRDGMLLDEERVREREIDRQIDRYTQGSLVSFRSTCRQDRKQKLREQQAIIASIHKIFEDTKLLHGQKENERNISIIFDDLIAFLFGLNHLSTSACNEVLCRSSLSLFISRVMLDIRLADLSK